MQNDIGARLEQIRQRINQAAERGGRDPSKVTLLGASKTVDPEAIKLATEYGLSHVGENRVQEADAKMKLLPSLRQSATWHMIGHLQSNKVRQALELMDVVQTIDDGRLARRMDEMAGELDIQLPIYIEVNLGLEPSKTGVAPDNMLALAEEIATCHNLKLEGLMAVPPYTPDPEGTRPYFQSLRQLSESLNQRQVLDYEVDGLSIGMSHDFEIAVEEGATMVRLGSSIWGARPA